MELKKISDLFALPSGEVISKRNLYDLVQFSKVEGSPYWSGPELEIGNTPQQGINWIGKLPYVQAVIIKTRPGSYKDDGWKDEEKRTYHYSFKAKNGVVSYKEKANEVLIKQPQYLYPILLFAEQKEGWYFEGSFAVSAIEDTFVVLNRGSIGDAKLAETQDETLYKEGERKYVTHLMAERSSGVVKALKEADEWVCDICKADFLYKYGVKYIEAHHKVPISSYSSAYKVQMSDFALLCPNCHKAVHIYMKLDRLEYKEIKAKLSTKWTR